MQFCLPAKSAALSSHRTKWDDCRLCPLSESRRQVVLWRGYVPCDILFVGEAPGINEDRLGYPFVGESGVLLDDLLTYTLDTINSEVAMIWRFSLPVMCITNIVCCMPIARSHNKIREPEKDEIAACNPRLREFIGIAEPKVIVGVGDLAVAAVRPKYEIKHPAALLRAEKEDFAPAYLQNVTTLMEAFRETQNKDG